MPATSPSRAPNQSAAAAVSTRLAEPAPPTIWMPTSRPSGSREHLHRDRHRLRHVPGDGRGLGDERDELHPPTVACSVVGPGAPDLDVRPAGGELGDGGAEDAAEPGVAAGEVLARDAALLVRVRAERHVDAEPLEALDRLAAVPGRPHAVRHLLPVVGEQPAEGAEGQPGVLDQLGGRGDAEPERDDVRGERVVAGAHGRDPAVRSHVEAVDLLPADDLDPAGDHGLPAPGRPCPGRACS